MPHICCKHMSGSNASTHRHETHISYILIHTNDRCLVQHTHTLTEDTCLVPHPHTYHSHVSGATHVHTHTPMTRVWYHTHTDSEDRCVVRATDPEPALDPEAAPERGILTSCGGAAASPSCRARRAVWRDACGPAEPALEGARKRSRLSKGGGASRSGRRETSRPGPASPPSRTLLPAQVPFREIMA